MDHEPTKLNAWLNEPGKRRTIAKLTASVVKRIGHASEKYIESVVDGYYPPGRKLAIALAEETGVPIADIIGYAYRAKRAA